MTYDLLQLDDRQMLDILAVARREGALVMVHAENHDMIKWLTDRLLERGLVAAALARGQPCPARRGRGDQPRRRPVAAARRADPDRPCLGRRGDRRDPQRPDQGPQDLRRDLPAIPVPDRRRHRQAGLEGAKFCCSPPPRDAAAQEAVWHGLAERHLPGVLLRPRALSLRRSPASCRRATRPPSRTSPTASPASNCACRCCFPRVSARAGSTSTVCRADRDQPRQALRALSEKGHDRGRQRRRHRDLGPGARGHGQPPACCTTMSATPPMRAATCTAGRSRSCSRGRIVVDNGALAAAARQRQFPPLRPLHLRQARRRPDPRTRPRRRPRRAAGLKRSHQHRPVKSRIISTLEN